MATARIAALTRNRVLGVDNAPGMIETAKTSQKTMPNLDFTVADATQLGFDQEFDVIYCNSAFQWFAEPVRAVKNFYRALNYGGRVGMQAPATATYCPNFLAAVDRVRESQTAAHVLATFRSPWFFLASPDGYRDLFERAGFHITYCAIQEDSQALSPEHVYQNFQVGAENGYLDPANYAAPLTAEYLQEFRRIVHDAFLAQAGTSGQVNLIFKRVYILAGKPPDSL